MKESSGLALAGIVVVAVILGLIFFSRDALAGMLGGGGFAGASGGRDEDPGATQPDATPYGGFNDSGATRNSSAQPVLVSAGSYPTESGGKASIYSREVSYESVGGKNLQTRNSQGIGGAGLRSNLHVPADAAFLFGGDARGDGLAINPYTRGPMYQAERRAGLRSEAVAAQLESEHNSGAQVRPDVQAMLQKSIAEKRNQDAVAAAQLKRAEKKERDAERAYGGLREGF